MIHAASFDRCPPVAWGVCMLDHGYPVDACAMSATCCVKAPVTVVNEVAARMAQRASAAASARWSREREAA